MKEIMELTMKKTMELTRQAPVRMIVIAGLAGFVLSALLSLIPGYGMLAFAAVTGLILLVYQTFGKGGDDK